MTYVSTVKNTLINNIGSFRSVSGLSRDSFCSRICHVTGSPQPSNYQSVSRLPACRLFRCHSLGFVVKTSEHRDTGSQHGTTAATICKGNAATNGIRFSASFNSHHSRCKWQLTFRNCNSWTATWLFILLYVSNDLVTLFYSCTVFAGFCYSVIFVSKK